MSMSDVRAAALGLERIDTHAHLKDTYPGLAERAAAWNPPRTTMQILDARITAEGCRGLYGIDPGGMLRADLPAGLAQKADELRARGPWEAVNHALDAAKITRQFAFSSFKEQWRPFREKNPARLAYLAYIDEATNGHWQYPCPDFAQADYRYHEALCKYFGPLPRLEDYLDALDGAIDGWRSWGVVGMKCAYAYTSGLSISDPTPAEARTAFARGNDMNDQDFCIVHDFAFRHCLAACRRNGLPVVIHTGFQIWGHADLRQSNPLNLHNLLIDSRYKDVTFVLLHGGNPYVGETSYLAGMFPNVVIDFTWIGWMTPGRFRRALSEWLAMVPLDRMCWGSDSGTPESIVGVDRVMRRQIADTLEQCVSEGLIDERYALEFIGNSYVKTARRVFGL